MQFKQRALEVATGCHESTMATGLEAAIERLRKNVAELRSLLYSLLILLRKVAYLQMDVAEAHALGLEEQHRDTASLEQRMQDVERLKFAARTKAQQLLKARGRGLPSRSC